MPKPTVETFALPSGISGFFFSDLTTDSQGNLYGTNYGQFNSGQPGSTGTVFKLAKTAAGYANTLSVIATFRGPDGSHPSGGLIVDGQGNLIGTTETGGAYGYGVFQGGAGLGTVFTIPKAGEGYTSAPTTLVSFNGSNGAGPRAGLIADAQGNLFGTTAGGGTTFTDTYNGIGTVFKLAKTETGYATAPTTLVSFTDANGRNPYGGLTMDAQGNLFGTTSLGGKYGRGTVFEVVRTETGYATAPTTLVSFTDANGRNPLGGLTMDAQGNLFGTTSLGGKYGRGTVFEIIRKADGYASVPKTLASFDGTTGAGPIGSLIADTYGNLFGATRNGGSNDQGTVFKIFKTAAGYSAPVVLVNFDWAVNGAFPSNSLVADAQGNLFGTTQMGGVFEVINSGFGSPAPPIFFTTQGSLTNKPKQSVSGYADPSYANRTVVIYEGMKKLATTKVGADGVFTASVTLSGQGQHDLFAQVASTSTVKSESITFTLDTVKPVVVITSPSISTIQPNQKISGTGETGTKVDLYDNNALVQTTKVDASGKWSFDLRLSPGSHAFVAKSTDAAGNVGVSSTVVEKLLAANAAGTVNIGDDVRFTDADFANLPGLKTLVFNGTGTSSVTLGANASADAGAKLTLTAGPTVTGLKVDGSAIGPATMLVLTGSKGDDIFIGGAGNDIFIGGPGHDLFDLTLGGRDIVKDFDVTQDVLRFVGHSLADLTITYSKGNVFISLDAAHQVTLQNVAPLSLTPSDFLFA